MPLDIKQIRPLRGEFSCNLWENPHTGLPLTLFYSIEIPLSPFNTGHDYVQQPAGTSIVMEWLKFTDPVTGANEKNWKNLAGKKFLVSYEDGTGEGSIYLGSEHCQFNSSIKFLSLQNTTFDIELTMNVAFNIDTINLDDNGQITVTTQVDFKGLLLYDNSLLPVVAASENTMKLIGEFIDAGVYVTRLTDYDNPHVQWQQLKPYT